MQVIDSTDPQTDLTGIDLTGKTLLQVWNKADLVNAQCTMHNAQLQISAKSGDVEVLKKALARITAEQMETTNTVTISNARHYEALVRASEAIRRVQQGLQDGVSGEFLSMDLQDCLTALGEITGQITSQEVLNNIFSHFCIGK